MKYINFDQPRFETVPANSRLLVTNEGIIIPETSFSRNGYIYSMEYPLGRFLRRTQVHDIPAQEDAVFTSFTKSWNIEKAHDWVRLWSSTTIDESQFREGLHCNGGAYRFGTERIFFARIQGDDIKFCYLDVHKTSSEFGYCQLTGTFAETTPIWFRNVQMEEILISTDEARNLGLELGDRQWDDLILDRVATPVEFKEVWNTRSTFIDEDGEESFPPTMHEKKDRIRRLKVLGAITNGEYKREVVKYHRANRADRQRYRKTEEQIQQIIEKM
jgi:hypothetical protein